MQQAKDLRDRGRKAAVARFMALPAVDDDHLGDWLDDVRPVSNGTASSSAQLASAFLAYSAGIVIARAIDGAKYTQDEIGTKPFADRYREPFIATWSALGNGQPFDQAQEAGAARAGLLVDEDAQWAQTTAMHDTEAVLADEGRTIRFYRRVPEEDACSFCSLVAGAVVLSDDLEPLHAACGCGIDPVFA
jgi:hypothetical protein